MNFVSFEFNDTPFLFDRDEIISVIVEDCVMATPYPYAVFINFRLPVHQIVKHFIHEEGALEFYNIIHKAIMER